VWAFFWGFERGRGVFVGEEGFEERYEKEEWV